PQRRREKPVPSIDLGGGVLLFDGHVTLQGSAEVQKEPVIALRAFAARVRHRAPLLLFARDAISAPAGAPAGAGPPRASPEAAEIFVDLVCPVPELAGPRGSVVGE